MSTELNNQPVDILTHWDKRLFTFGELWTNDGWPCDHGKSAGMRPCPGVSHSVALSPAEVDQIITALPDECPNGHLQGGAVANYILQHNLGIVLCDKHLEEFTLYSPIP